MSTPTPTPNGAEPTARVDLTARPERRLIRPGGSHRHIDFAVQVTAAAPPPNAQRPPVAVGLVIDRSGSMHGEKLTTAKQAALAVVDQLTDRDRVALVVFDDQIDVIQPATAVAPVIQARLRAALQRIESRGSTALHEGWLTGCQAIAGDAQGEAIARCFLLTDGQANVGQTDPEAIASEAAAVRAHAGVGTSTFGIGADYDEDLLAPLATAGGGQFYHLRGPAEIATTFVEELGDLLAIAARNARLEISAAPGVTLEVISQFWVEQTAEANVWTISLGDLVAQSDPVHVVVRCGFPATVPGEDQAVNARIVWSDGRREQATEWREVRFTGAPNSACDAEPRDAEAMRIIGRHQTEQARRDAARQSKLGDLPGARRTLRMKAAAIRAYAGDDADLQEALSDLADIEAQVATAPAAPLTLKEQYYQSSIRSRGKRDRRGGP